MPAAGLPGAQAIPARAHATPARCQALHNRLKNHAPFNVTMDRTRLVRCAKTHALWLLPDGPSATRLLRLRAEEQPLALPRPLGLPVKCIVSCNMTASRRSVFCDV